MSKTIISDIREQDPIWINEKNDWLKGFLIARDGENYLVEHKSIKFLVDKIFIRNNDEIDCKDNLIDIPFLNEPSILNAINLRFDLNKIYTYTGKILISVNPFKNLELYSEEVMKKYKRDNNLVPHIYEIANNAYKNFEENQTILISGESGAGKTHATRNIMKYLAYISHKERDNINIEEKVIQSNPILEAFGNAKTTRNDNSSRFGKFIKLQLNNSKELIGGKIETYLLEKIRVVSQSEKERNFHIFYQLLSSDKKEKYYLEDFSKYKFLNNKYIYRCDNVEDDEDFLLTLNGMRVIGFTEIEIDNIFKIISSILHIGNIEIIDGSICNMELLYKISKLLNIKSELIVNSLLYRFIEVQNEIIRIDLKSGEIDAAKNSLSMKLYEDLFTFIVRKINIKLDKGSDKFIGILDIFGFESFNINRFEQLCINYTNEKLQQQFNMYIFKLEQIEYESEGIDWTEIKFPDNQECINLLAGKNSLIDMLDEETRLPKGSSDNFTKRFLKRYNNNKYLEGNKKYAGSKFTIRHYAGEVEYTTDYFYEKNKDLISNEIKDLLGNIPYLKIEESSKKKKSVMIQFRKSLNSLMNLIDKTEPHYIRCIKPNDMNKSNYLNRARVNDQLKYSGILEAIKVARAGYPIRYKKSVFDKRYFMINNFTKIVDSKDYKVGKSKIFLKMSGFNKLEKRKKEILEEKLILIQKMIRMFLIRNRYRLLLSKIVILQTFGRIIISKCLLNKLRKNKNSIEIQKIFRSYILKKKYQYLRRCIILIQRYYRDYVLKIRTNVCIKIQTFYRGYIAHKKYKSFLVRLVKLQKVIRKFLKYQNTVNNKNKKLEKELEQLKIKNEKDKKELSKHLKELETKVLQEEENRIKKERELEELKEATIKEKRVNLAKEKELEILSNGMKRSITEKMRLTKQIEELIIENDKIRRLANNRGISDTCLLM